jgi:hypothetical protein
MTHQHVNHMALNYTSEHQFLNSIIFSLWSCAVLNFLCICIYLIDLLSFLFIFHVCWCPLSFSTILLSIHTLVALSHPPDRVGLEVSLVTFLGLFCLFCLFFHLGCSNTLFFNTILHKINFITPRSVPNEGKVKSSCEWKCGHFEITRELRSFAARLQDPAPESGDSETSLEMINNLVTQKQPGKWSIKFIHFIEPVLVSGINTS